MLVAVTESVTKSCRMRKPETRHSITVVMEKEIPMRPRKDPG